MKRLADKYGAVGFVTNENDHVVMEVQGDDERVGTVLKALAAFAETYNVHFTKHSVDPLRLEQHNGLFTILTSDYQCNAGALSGLKRFPGDNAVCPECLEELFTKGNRRFGYGFIACTTCGPRYSVMTSVPYDRERTHFQKFPLCMECQKEYSNSADRRHHAQTISCPDCGPRWAVSFCDRFTDTFELEGTITDDLAIAKKGADSLSQGGVLCLQGASGFHLMVNAIDSVAVKNLRERKSRPRKPFALMMKNIEMVRAYCELNAQEERVLTSPRAPIVLVKKRSLDEHNVNKLYLPLSDLQTHLLQMVCE